MNECAVICHVKKKCNTVVTHLFALTNSWFVFNSVCNILYQILFWSRKIPLISSGVQRNRWETLFLYFLRSNYNIFITKLNHTICGSLYILLLFFFLHVHIKLVSWKTCETSLSQGEICFHINDCRERSCFTGCRTQWFVHPKTHLLLPPVSTANRT